MLVMMYNQTLHSIIKYFNVYTHKYRCYSVDFIRWVSYDSLERAEQGIVEECRSHLRFKKTIIIEVDEDFDDDYDLDDDFFNERFPNTQHYDGGNIEYDAQND